MLSLEQRFNICKQLNTQANEILSEKQGDKDAAKGALQLYKRALELVASDPSKLKTKLALMTNCATCFQTLEEWQSVADQTELVLKQDDNHGKCLKMRAFALFHLNRQSDAKDVCVQAIKASPNDKELRTLYDKIKLLLQQQKP
jgi:tetratricopeptide (TPR) repeat protein